MKRTEEILVDLKSKDFYELRLKQFDSTQLQFIVRDNGQEVSLNNLTSNLIFTKPNGKIVIQTAEIDNENKKIVIDLKEDCVRNPGKARIEVELLENDEIVSTFQMVCKIEASGKDKMVSEDDPSYWEEANELLNELEEMKENGAFDGKSAYEVAVENGYDGTAKEWLDSLKGKTPVKGTDYFDDNDKQEIVDDVVTATTPNFEQKHTIYRKEVTEEIEAESEMTLDFSYKSDMLEVYYCGERLLKDEDYEEVFDEGSETSNKIKILFDIPLSEEFPRYFDFVVKGVIEDA